MEKVRIGNDMRVNFSVYRNGQPESFDGASNISTKLVNEAYNKEITHTYTIAGNVVQFDIDALQLTQCGKCRLFISYTKGGDYTVDSPAFELVNYTDQTGGTEIIGVEIVSINISGDIGINRDGLSAYEVWEAYPGNEGKPIEQYFLWLRENPTKIDLDGLNSNIDKLHFNPDTLVQLTSIGDVRYSQESRTLEVKVSDTVSIQLGQEMQTRVKNDEAVQINNGQMVYINSAAGANPLAKIASTSNSDVAQKTFGMATENIPANGFGAITTEGLVRDINTSAFPEGAMLWLGTNGSITNIEPVAPVSKISVGMVLRSNANNGVVYVKIRAIARNQKLSDVYAPTLTGGDVLRWNSTTLRFETFNITSALSNKVDTSRSITAGDGLTGGGSLTEDRTININPADDSLTVTADNIKVNTNNTLTSTSTTQPLSANQGKVLNEKVVQVETDLNYMYPSVGTAKRILTDAGTIKSRSTLNDLTNKFLDLLPNTKLLFCPHLAVKLRESGIYKYVIKLYDIGPAMLDGAQTTALNQPYLSGNIAPTEKYALKNPNGGATYMTHTPISFSATDKWSVSTMLNANGQTGNAELCGALGKSDIRINADSDVMFINSATPSAGSTVFNKYNKFYGKNTMLTFTSLGDGFLSLYINGAFISKNVVDTTSDFSGLLYSRDGNSLGLKGEIRYHCIRNIALSPTQVADEYNYLRTLFPEIESVQIGTQTWATSNCEMTCTPQGRIIQEMQAATNVEKVVGGDFEANMIFSLTPGASNATLSINNTAPINGLQDCRLVTSSLSGDNGRPSLTFYANASVINKYYKVSFKYKVNSGMCKIRSILLGGTHAAYGDILNGSGIFTKYVLSTQSGNNTGTLYFDGTYGIFDVQIDDLSVQQVGWSDSTNLYNYVYANTTGTAEQKEYAAVKAASMWRNVNNDPVLASVFGKKFNKYAKRLLAMDINYYNVANPTSLWGWDIPTQAQLTTLASNGGNALKVGGPNYWNTTNGINSTWLTLLGGGYIDATGNYLGNKTHEGVWAKDADIARVALDADNSFNEVAATTEGYSIRLIKI